jgi:hypothetical protein
MTTSYYPSFSDKPLEYKVLSILALIFGAITLVFSLVFMILGGIKNDLIEFMRPGVLPQRWVELGGLIYSIVAFILSLIAFIGLIQIWNRVKSGFWLFSASMLVFLLLPFIFLKVPFFWLFKTLVPFIVISGLFILLLYHNLRHMD